MYVQACQDLPLLLFFPLPGNMLDFGFCQLHTVCYLKYQGTCIYGSEELMQICIIPTCYLEWTWLNLTWEVNIIWSISFKE